MRKGIEKFSSLGGHQLLFKTAIEIFKVINKGHFGTTLKHKCNNTLRKLFQNRLAYFCKIFLKKYLVEK